MRGVVEELAGRAEGGVRGEGGEGEAEDGGRGLGVQGVFEVALVEDVALRGLDEEEDAGRVAEGGGAVGGVGGGEAGREGGGAGVWGEVEGGEGGGVVQEGVFCGGEVSSRGLVRVGLDRGRGGAGIYLCRAEVWEERPPKEEAMVLNSTCLIWSPSSSWWTM